MEIAKLLITFGFTLQIIAIIFLLFKKKKTKTKIIKTNNIEDLKQFMTENSFETELLDQMKNNNTLTVGEKAKRM